MAITPREFKSERDLQHEVRDLLCEALSAARQKNFAVMLSGGSTPLPVYEAIADSPFAVSKCAYITYSDDRHVPADSEESNYGNSLEMIAALGIPESRIIRVHTEKPLEDAAEAFHNDLGAFLRGGGVIPLAIIGLGTDGHTCSLFTESDLIKGEGKYAIAVQKSSGPDRVSVTPELLAQVERIIILVSGEAKKEISDQLLADPNSVVAGKAVSACPNVELWRA